MNVTKITKLFSPDARFFIKNAPNSILAEAPPQTPLGAHSIPQTGQTP